MTRSKGFSLIELMLALTLGLIVTAGIVQLFVGNTQTNMLLTGQSRLQESARYALDFISRSARSAGYFGCDPGDNVFNTLNGSWNQIYEFNISVPIESYDYTGSTGTALGDWTPSASTLPRMTGVGTSFNTFINGNGIELSDANPGSDILVLRRVQIPGSRIDSIVQPNASPVVEDNGNLGIAANDFAVISNCEQAALFRVTGVTAGAGNATLGRTSGGGGVFENSAAATLSEIGVAYGLSGDSQGTTVGRVVTDIYFVANGAGTNNRGDTPLSLWRKTAAAAPVELVEGIVDLQVLFGVDTTPADDIDAPNQYLGSSLVNATDVIRTLRIQITASTIDVVTGNEQTVERTFSQTISLRNTG